jgi:hypothetical protein
VIYLRIPEKRMTIVSIPLTIVSKGTRSAQNSLLNSKRIPDKAPAIPKTLCLLEAVSAAIPHHQIPVRRPVSGSSPLARASEIERGMFIIATASPACQLCFHHRNDCFIVLNIGKNKVNQHCVPLLQGTARGDY